MRKFLIVAAVLIVAAAAAALVVHRTSREWTTDSPAALAELEQGLQDALKVYHREAAEHFERALEIDPDFVAPKVWMVRSRMVPRERMHLLIEELRSRDLAHLTPRERLMVEYLLATVDHRADSAEALLTAYLADHPNDPFAIELSCGQLWQRRQWPEAEACYRRLIAADPNWVVAQNHLGYIAMAQGRFAEAEEQFEIYRFIAPDQPNPHDSLGELLMLVGRWREARQEMEEALRIKPDFCASWKNRVQIALLEGAYDDAQAVLGRAEEAGGCEPSTLRRLGCQARAWKAFDAGDWQGVWEAAQASDCGSQIDDLTVISYEAALNGGMVEKAAALEDRIAELAAKYGPEEHMVNALELHLAGIRLLHDGHPEAAVEKLRAVDDMVDYWSAGQGFFKLATRIQLAHALVAADRPEEAAATVAEVRRVSPPLADRWRAPKVG